MEADGSYPGEITSVHVNLLCHRDVSTCGKKRKFLAETNDQLSFPASKYTCCETLIEHDPFLKESLQAKFFYPHMRKEKASLQEADEDAGAESAQDSNSTVEDSFTQRSDFKPDGYAKANSYYESSLSYSSSGRAMCRKAYYSSDITKMSNIATDADREYTTSHQTEVLDNGNCEDQLDEFVHCLGCLASACDNDSKQQSNEELEDIFLYANDMVSNSYLLSSEGLTADQESQLCARKPTIDQEFEQYFSMLML